MSTSHEWKPMRISFERFDEDPALVTMCVQFHEEREGSGASIVEFQGDACAMLLEWGDADDPSVADEEPTAMSIVDMEGLIASYEQWKNENPPAPRDS